MTPKMYKAKLYKHIRINIKHIKVIVKNPTSINIILSLTMLSPFLGKIKEG